MSRLQQVDARYSAMEALTVVGIELVAVADEAGSKLNRAVNELRRHAREDGLEILDELLAVSRQLRWRVATEPFPGSYSYERHKVLQTLQHLAARIKLTASGALVAILEDLVAAATAVNVPTAPPTADTLLQSLAEAGPGGCVVIVASARARGGMTRWLAEAALAVEVRQSTDRELADVVEHVYLAGSPGLFGPSALSSPQGRALTYIFPSWVQDRTLPTSRFSAFAEGAARLQARQFTVGQPAPEPPIAADDPLAPAPSWSRRQLPAALKTDEVLARRVLLGGGLAIMLDRGGEHIRTFDPGRPTGERVEFRDVATIEPGSYLVLREGETESEALYARAIGLLGDHSTDVLDSQRRWKDELNVRLDRLGRTGVSAALRTIGVRAADQAATWTGRTVARPQVDRDFELLLGWLGLPLQPYLTRASAVRRARLQAMADVREALEDALSVANMDRLDRDGYLRLDLPLAGFAGIIATRVVAIAPFDEAVPRRELRLPIPDRRALWLE